MVITVQITPNGKVTEMTAEEADEQKGDRIYSGMSLNTPETWEHNRYRLTMTMLDTFDYEKRRYKRDCNHPLSPHAVARLHARRHNLGDGLYKQRDNRQYHRLYKGGPDVYLQAGI